MVGAVLVHNDEIIGEGYHEIYGGPHAEVNCFKSVNEAKLKLIPKSTLYVNLEPCCHTGKTPPCVDLIIDKKPAQVVIGCLDSSKKVNGKGMRKLQAAGIDVQLSEMQALCAEFNRKFLIAEELQRPYIILKWAESHDGYIAKPNERTRISTTQSNSLNHLWRSEEDAILIGYRTALIDKPKLNVREVKGRNPIRIVIDKDLSLPRDLNLFNKESKTIVCNKKFNRIEDGIQWIKYDNLKDLLKQLYALKIGSVIVEGGTKTIETFLSEALWDEIRQIKSIVQLDNGVKAPRITDLSPSITQKSSSDLISTYYR